MSTEKLKPEPQRPGTKFANALNDLTVPSVDNAQPIGRRTFNAIIASAFTRLFYPRLDPCATPPEDCEGAN